MKGCLVSVALLLACLTVTVVGQTECGIYADTLAHPTDCSKYYTLNLHSCPPGLLYNKNTRQCVAPEASTCGDPDTTSTEPTTNTTQTTPSTNTTQTTPSTNTTQTTPSTNTTQTTPSTNTTQTTPSTNTTLTTPSTNTTQTTPSTNTTQTTPSTNTTQTTPSTNTTQTTPSTNTTQTTPSTNTTQTTPSTNVTATTPSTIATSTTPTTSAPTVETTTSSELPLYSCPPVDDPSTKIRYAHETNCKYYYLCVNGATALYTCTSVQHFNPVKRVCEAINQAGCDRCPDVEDASVVVRLPHETVCQYYYKCSTDGSTTLYKCAGDADFSRIERKCLTPSEARCTLLATGEVEGAPSRIM